MKSNLMKIFSVILFISSFYFNFAFANELKLTTDPNAVCNNGEQATFTIKKGKSNKWAVILPGGGIARNSEEYRSRPESMKSPELKPHYFSQGIEKDLEDRNYNLVFIPYCSSDLYQSDHINLIDGNEVPFRGRVIVEDVINKIDKKLMNADEVMFLGYSAGAIGIGFHAKTIGRYKNIRVLVDSFWVDEETKKFFQNFEKKTIEALHIKAQWKHVTIVGLTVIPQEITLKKNNIKDVFFIWNIGDKYANGVKDKLALKKAIKKDLEFYNAGFSIEADKRKISGFEDWGHVLAWDNKTYTKNYFDMSLQEAVNNWIDKKGNAVIVDYLLSEEKKAEINKKSKLFDGEYKFKLYRSSEDGKNKKIGNGKLEIKNGQLTFFIKSSKLKTGPKDHYETAKIDINPNGELNGSIKLDILSGKDRSEVYYFKGMLNDKIWGASPDESFFKVYIEIKK